MLRHAAILIAAMAGAAGLSACSGGGDFGTQQALDPLYQPRASANPAPQRGAEEDPAGPSSPIAGSTGSSFSRSSNTGMPTNQAGAPGWPYGQ